MVESGEMDLVQAYVCGLNRLPRLHRLDGGRHRIRTGVGFQRHPQLTKGARRRTPAVMRRFRRAFSSRGFRPILLIRRRQTLPRG